MIKKLEWFNYNKAILLLLIIALFVILKTIFTPPETIQLIEQIKTDLVKESEIVLDKLTNGQEEISLLNSNELIVEEVIKLDQMSYNEVKNMFGVKNDFCIYFEDVSGNLVKFDNTNLGIGSNKIYIDGNLVNRLFKQKV